MCAHFTCSWAAGANVDEKNDNQWTALHSAAGEGYIPVVQSLLAVGSKTEENDIEKK